MKVTFFESPAAQIKREETHDFDSLLKLLVDAPKAKRKQDLPWLKLASFGETRTAKKSLRHDANVIEVHGVEIDYDDGELQPKAALKRLKAAGIQAIVYTSPSYTPEYPKWRVLAPFAQPLTGTKEEIKARRDDCVEHLAATLNVPLDVVSMTLSQSYYYGSLYGAPYAAAGVYGTCVDQLDRPEKANGSLYSGLSDEEALTRLVEDQQPKSRLTEALEALSVGGSERDNHPHLVIVTGHYVAKGYPDETIMQLVNPYYDPGEEPEIERMINGARAKQFATGDDKKETRGPQSFPSEAMRPVHIAPREWVLGRRLLRGSVSALVGAPGAGKTQLAVQTALAVASGQSWVTGEDIHTKGPVVLFSNEEPEEELWRRIIGACSTLELAVPDGLHVYSGYGNAVRLLDVEKYGGCQSDREAINWLTGIAHKHQAVFMSLDPFGSLSSADENDNAAIEQLMNVLREVASVSQTAVEVLQHTSKGTGRAMDPLDLYAGRGASAVVGAVRVSSNISPMSHKEAAEYGVGDDERTKYVWLSGAKGNYSEVTDRIWFERVSGELGNGDSVPVLMARDREGFMAELQEKRRQAASAESIAKERAEEDDAKALCTEILALVNTRGPMSAPAISEALDGWHGRSAASLRKYHIKSAMEWCGEDFGLEKVGTHRSTRIARIEKHEENQ